DGAALVQPDHDLVGRRHIARVRRRVRPQVISHCKRAVGRDIEAPTALHSSARAELYRQPRLLLRHYPAPVPAQNHAGVRFHASGVGPIPTGAPTDQVTRQAVLPHALRTADAVFVSAPQIVEGVVLAVDVLLEVRAGFVGRATTAIQAAGV